MELNSKKEYRKPAAVDLSVGAATMSPTYKGTAKDESGQMMAQNGIGPS